MSEHIDLVIVRHEGTDTAPYMFQAPYCSLIHKGDLVEVETCKGKSRGTVLEVCSVWEDSAEYRCFQQMAKMRPFKRVLRVFKARELEYKDYMVSETIDGAKTILRVGKANDATGGGET